MLSVDVPEYRLMHIVVNRIVVDDGAGCPEALPPDQAVGLGLAPPSSRLEARHAGGGLARGSRKVLGMHMGDGPGIIVLNGRKIKRAARAVPVADLELNPTEVICGQALRL